MILTEVGEIGVHAAGKVHRLRPSFYAMSQLGTPKEIVQTYALIMAEMPDDKSRWMQFQEALCVIHTCAEEDLSDVFGYFNERMKYRKGSASMADILPLARCLLKHGITGSLKELPRKAGEEPNYTPEFNARDHVAVAMAHLGLTEADAWQMTMTGLVAALRAKYPPEESKTPGARAPTKEEHEATEAWFERIDARRKAKKLIKAGKNHGY